MTYNRKCKVSSVPEMLINDETTGRVRLAELEAIEKRQQERLEEARKNKDFVQLTKTNGMDRIDQLLNEYPSKLALNIYLFLMRHLDPGLCGVVVSQDLLAEQMGVTTRTIRTVTKWMEDKGAFDRYKISGSVYAYCLDPLEVSNTWNDAKQYVPFNTKTLASVRTNPKLVMKQPAKTKTRKTVTQKTQVHD